MMEEHKMDREGKDARDDDIIKQMDPPAHGTAILTLVPKSRLINGREINLYLVKPLLL